MEQNYRLKIKEDLRTTPNLSQKLVKFYKALRRTSYPLQNELFVEDPLFQIMLRIEQETHGDIALFLNGNC